MSTTPRGLESPLSWFHNLIKNTPWLVPPHNVDRVADPRARKDQADRSEDQAQIQDLCRFRSATEDACAPAKTGDDSLPSTSLQCLVGPFRVESGYQCLGGPPMCERTVRVPVLIDCWLSLLGRWILFSRDSSVVVFLCLGN